MVASRETPVFFDCDGEQLLGIVHEPGSASTVGVLIVVGGPQYRVGSHRQFLLLARYLADNGIPVMRFDYRGMGDSTGALHSFEGVDLDIRAAIDKFVEESSAIKEIVIWGLCDAASAALFYAPTDSRVAGLVLLNPWVRTEQGEAKAYLKKYYLARLFSRDFWKKVLKGGFKVRASLASLNANIGKSLKGSAARSKSTSLPERMLNGFSQFNGESLFILSGNDLTAEEFRNLVKASGAWKTALANSNATFEELAEANHTFSSREWRHKVELWTLSWLKARFSSIRS
jgi:exosortase A-associated hydrolase 1